MISGFELEWSVGNVPSGQDTMERIAALASSVVESTPMVLPLINPACASCCNTQWKTS